MLSYEGESFDMGTLFQFEQLKKILELLCKENKAMKEKIQSLEDRDNQRSEDIKTLQSQLSDPSHKVSQRKNTGKSHEREDTNKQGNSQDQQNKPEDDQGHKNEDGIGNDNGDNIGNEDNNDYDLDNENMKSKNQGDLITILFKRMKDADKKIKDLNCKNRNLITETKALQTADSRLSSKLNDIDAETKSELSTINSKLNELFEKQTKMNDVLDEISVKVQDFNIYDLFKDSGDGTVDMSKALILTLEQKVFKKFSLVDERNKEAAGEIIKLKNDMLNLKNMVDSANRSVTRHKEDLAEYKKNTDEIISAMTNQNDEMDKNIQSNYSELLELCTRNKIDMENLINERIENVYQVIMKDISENNPNSNAVKAPGSNEDKTKKIITKGGGMTDDERKLLREIRQKVIDMDAVLKSKPNASDINKLIKDIQEELKTKLTKNDLDGINTSCAINDQSIKDINNTIAGIFEDNRKINSENNAIGKKLESLNGTIINMQSMRGSIGTDPKNSYMDLSKYIDQNKLAENNKLFMKEIDKLQKEDADFRRTLDEINNRLNSFATNEEMKANHNYLTHVITEYKIAVAKKYLDKTEFHKAMKLLDIEIKTLGAMKKSDGDNWLLAKRPLNLYKCASCESNIGDLANQSKEYLPWNKYPVREEKSYRMGNGFSRMLQMSNPEMMRNLESKQFSTDSEDSKSGGISGGKGNKSVNKLPRVKIKRNNVVLDDQVTYSDGVHTNENQALGLHKTPLSPKVVKIFKKPKNSRSEVNINQAANNNINLPLSINQPIRNSKLPS